MPENLTAEHSQATSLFRPSTRRPVESTTATFDQRALADELEDPAERFEAFGRDMKLITSIQAAWVNFGSWACVPDQEHEGRYRMEVRDVEGVPDGLFIATSGLLTGCSESLGSTLPREYERPDPDFALIRMLQST